MMGKNHIVGKKGKISSKESGKVAFKLLSCVLFFRTVCGYATVVSVSVFDYCDCAQSGDCNSHWTPFGP